METRKTLSLVIGLLGLASGIPYLIFGNFLIGLVIIVITIIGVLGIRKGIK